MGETTTRYQVTGYDTEGAVRLQEEIDTEALSVPAAGIARISVAQISSSFGEGRKATIEL